MSFACCASRLNPCSTCLSVLTRTYATTRGLTPIDSPSTNWCAVLNPPILSILHRHDKDKTDSSVTIGSVSGGARSNSGSPRPWPPGSVRGRCEGGALRREACGRGAARGRLSQRLVSTQLLRRPRPPRYRAPDAGAHERAVPPRGVGAHRHSRPPLVTHRTPHGRLSAIDEKMPA